MTWLPRLPHPTRPPQYKAAQPHVPLWKTLRTYVGVALIVIWGLAPFYWMVVTAFRDLEYTFDTTPCPTHVTLDNFRTVFSTDLGNHFTRALVNSLIIGVCTTIIGLMAGVFAAYALARLEFRGKYVVLGIVLGASMFPGVALVTPLFELFRNIGWFGTYQALIIPNISFVLPLTIYTLTAFFKEMPWELEEAAKIDGATPGPGLPAGDPAARRTGPVHHGDPGVHRVLERVPDRQPAEQRQDPTGDGRDRAVHRRRSPRSSRTPPSWRPATVVTIPLIIMVLLFQRKIVAGLTAGGVKG